MQFSGVQIQYTQAKENLKQAQYQVQANPHLQNLYVKEQQCIKEFQKWQQCLERFLIQKTKEDWLNLGDTNDQYFYAKLKQYHHGNRISLIKLEDGTWTWDYAKVTQHFVHYFENLLGTSAVLTDCIDDNIIAMRPSLNRSQQLALLRPFTRKEIKDAIFCNPNHKSPGPDGFTIGFFKSA